MQQQAQQITAFTRQYPLVEVTLQVDDWLSDLMASSPSCVRSSKLRLEYSCPIGSTC